MPASRDPFCTPCPVHTLLQVGVRHDLHIFFHGKPAAGLAILLPLEALKPVWRRAQRRPAMPAAA